MKLFGVFLLFACLLFYCLATPQEDAKVGEFLNYVNKRLKKLYNDELQVMWLMEIKGLRKDPRLLYRFEAHGDEIVRFLTQVAPKTAAYKTKPIFDKSLRRQLELIPKPGFDLLGQSDWIAIHNAIAHSAATHKYAKFCAYKDLTRCDISLHQMQQIMKASKEVDEINHYWLEWRRVLGKTTKQDFITFVKMYKKAAALNGFSQASDFWYRHFELNSAEAKRLINSLMEPMQPLYRQLHAHLRGSLRERYGADLIKKGRVLPQSLAAVVLTGAHEPNSNENLSFDLPYPEIGLPDIKAALKKINIQQPEQMFNFTTLFYLSLGMPKLEENFWQMHAKPKADAEEHCYPRAIKSYGSKEVNISYCPEINEEEFYDMIELMCDVYYLKAYKDQPTVFQEECFPNFSDAIGKVFSLSMLAPSHMEKLTMIAEEYTTKKARLNRLYKQGLKILFPLPLFQVLEAYRLEAIEGILNMTDNCAYWSLMESYTGMGPPIQRSPHDFDAAAQLAMGIDEQYTSQILCTAVQFQLYKHFCELTGQYNHKASSKPLDLCDLSSQPNIGTTLMNAMSLGSSQPFSEILRILTNDTSISIDGLLTYFEPLYDWLVKENRRKMNEIGWASENKCISPTPIEPYEEN